MPKIVKHVGSGMTKRVVVKFDQTKKEDMNQMMRAAIDSFERTSFQRISVRLEAIARRVLEQAAEDAVPGQIFQPDSPPGYALQMLDLLAMAKRHVATGSMDEAMAVAVAIGELDAEGAIKEMWEPDALAGEKAREGGRKANEQTYGTKDEKAARRKKQLQAYDASIASGATIMAAYRQAGRECNVSWHTIERVVRDRRRMPNLT